MPIAHGPAVVESRGEYTEMEVIVVSKHGGRLGEDLPGWHEHGLHGVAVP